MLAMLELGCPYKHHLPYLPDVSWAFCLPLMLFVSSNRSNDTLICSGLFPERLYIAFTAYKILLCLILLGLSFFSSHLSVGFCVLCVSISTLHSSSPEDSSCFCSPFIGEGCWNYSHRTSRRTGGENPHKSTAFCSVQFNRYPDKVPDETRVFPGP